VKKKKKEKREKRKEKHFSFLLIEDVKSSRRSKTKTKKAHVIY
jgi:hypothetical protein